MSTTWPLRGQHDHRRLDAALAQLAQHVEAVEPRQHHVEQHQVDASPARALEPALAVRARLDGVAFAGQPIAQRQHQTGLVLDEQQPLHAWRPCRAPRTRRRRPTGSSARGRQDDGELAARAGRAADDDASAVRLDDPLDEAETEAGALGLRGDDVGGAVERLEDARLLRGRDADAAIRDGDVNVAAAWRARAIADPAALARRT